MSKARKIMRIEETEAASKMICMIVLKKIIEFGSKKKFVTNFKSNKIELYKNKPSHRPIKTTESQY
jgi:hypothetical protein